MKDKLIERLDNNFFDFNIYLDSVSRSNLIKMAGRIAAVTNVHSFFTKEFAWDDENEVEYYLLFKNPLTVLADVWENRCVENAADIDIILYEIDGTSDIFSEYPLMPDADEGLKVVRI